MNIFTGRKTNYEVVQYIVSWSSDSSECGHVGYFSSKSINATISSQQQTVYVYK